MIFSINFYEFIILNFYYNIIMNCTDLIEHRKKLDNYYSNIIEKIDKIQLAFEQNTLILNNKINNYFTNIKDIKNINKICNDIKQIIVDQSNEYNTNILTYHIKSIKDKRITKGLPLIIKAPNSETKVQNYINPINTPLTPPPKYNNSSATDIDDNYIKPVKNYIKPSAPEEFYNNIKPSAPEEFYNDNIKPSAPEYNQLNNIQYTHLFNQTYVPSQVIYNPVTLYQQPLPLTNIQEKPIYNKYVLDHMKPVYTTRLENSVKKNNKNNCVII